MNKADSNAPKHENASLETCNKITQSYGATTTVMEFLDGCQVTKMQALSKWFYLTAVKRVQTRIRQADRVFVVSGPYSFKIMLPSLKVIKKHRGILKIKASHVQVGQKLFQLQDNRECRWVSFESDVPLIEVAAKAKFYTPRICIVQDQQIVALQDGSLRCQRYLIDRNVWKEQSIPRGRCKDFSICAVQDWVYLIGGYHARKKLSEHILRRQFKLDQPSTDGWETVLIQVFQLYPRSDCIVVPMKGNRICILGGKSYDFRYIPEVSVYDHETENCQVVSQKGPQLTFSDSKSFVMHNKLLLTTDKLLISYDLMTHTYIERDLPK